MRMRRVRGPAIVGTAVVASLLAGVLPASAAPGDGSARGSNIRVTLLNKPAVVAGPFAAANTLPTGPETNTFVSANVPSVLSTGVIDTSATRDDRTGVVTSTATAAKVRSGILGPGNTISADVIAAKCTSTQRGQSGSATLANLDLGGLGKVSATPAPNTTIEVSAPAVDTTIARIVFNEQIRSSDGSLTVNALHIKLIEGVLGAVGNGDVVVSKATCAPANPSMPLASGPGLWIGLGLLGLLAIPVATVALRRRRTQSAT